MHRVESMQQLNFRTYSINTVSAVHTVVKGLVFYSNGFLRPCCWLPLIYFKQECHTEVVK